MANENIPFQSIDWSNDPSKELKGETGSKHICKPGNKTDYEFGL